MFHPNYLKALDVAREIHKEMGKNINFQVEDKKLAIYFLQGGNITQSYLAIKAWENGDSNTVFRAKRFIHESMELSLFFSVLPDNDRHIKSWFSDIIVGVPDLNLPKNRIIKEDILRITGWDENQFDLLQKNSKEIKHGFSKGVHPNFRAVVYNFDKKIFEFDYQCEKLSFYPIENFDFARFIIIPTLQSIGAFHSIIPISQEDIQLLRNWISQIDSISKSTSN